jgi:hypothetical protein
MDLVKVHGLFKTFLSLSSMSLAGVVQHSGSQEEINVLYVRYLLHAIHDYS